MTGDILYINNLHWDIVEKITANYSHVIKPKSVFAIGGASGSGKSCVSYCLAQTLKKQGYFVKVIQMDNYYQIPARIRNEWRLTEGIESIGYNEISWDILNNNIADFKNNKTSVLPLTDLLCDLETSQHIDFSKVDILIVEGLYALKVDSADAKFFIDVMQEDIMKAQKLRNKEKLTAFRKQIIEKECMMVEQLKPIADSAYVINYSAINLAPKKRQKQSVKASKF